MIIKIRYSGSKKWWTYDGITEITYYDKAVEITSESNRKQFGACIDYNFIDSNIPDWTDNTHVVWYNKIRFKTKYGLDKTVIFDTVAYICNDDGKIVEKLPVSQSH